MDSSMKTARISIAKYFMKKPKPWKQHLVSENDSVDIAEKRANINRLCRMLRVMKSPKKFSLKNGVRLKQKCGSRRRRKEIPFLLRSCIKGRDGWNRYESKMKEWAIEQHEKRRRERQAAKDARKAKRCSDGDTSGGSCSTSERSLYGVQQGELLRSFYTVWNVNQLSTSTRTFEEARREIERLSQSPAVENCITKTPKDGIKEEEMLAKESLSDKTRLTLTRLARVIRDDDDALESSDSEDVVDVWNRAVEVAQSNSQMNLSTVDEEVSTKAARGCSFSNSEVVESPKVVVEEAQTSRSEERMSGRLRSSERSKHTCEGSSATMTLKCDPNIRAKKTGRESVENEKKLEQAQEVVELGHSGEHATSTDKKSFSNDDWKIESRHEIDRALGLVTADTVMAPEQSEKRTKVEKILRTRNSQAADSSAPEHEAGKGGVDHVAQNSVTIQSNEKLETNIRINQTPARNVMKHHEDRIGTTPRMCGAKKARASLPGVPKRLQEATESVRRSPRFLQKH
ncbi:hypothetical protein Tcan_08007 [Toxocara canis]|uniref:Uncharacterized protein n=1 Tax=Toxocara canis TaxID=6265 RepID=A0A0B2VDA7_TOXCA|nr:hypothetical protein Tcan_08007 [Toxocara canis]